MKHKGATYQPRILLPLSLSSSSRGESSAKNVNYVDKMLEGPKQVTSFDQCKLNFERKTTNFVASDNISANP